MANRPILVLADDLTGAAEVAAIAHEAGLNSVVMTSRPTRQKAGEADVVVYDTDTRLLPPGMASRRTKSLLRRLKAQSMVGVFIKTDSVLRGPVRAGLEAAAAILGRPRTLLVPANPSLGRIIRNGQYAIDGIPLNETAFARDPHHPAFSSVVTDLLGPAKDAPTVCLAPGQALATTGLLVGDAWQDKQITDWAGLLDDTTLPAGAADFFRAWLHRQTGTGTKPARFKLPTGAALLLHGTMVVSAGSTALIFHGLRAPSTKHVAFELRRWGAAAITAAPVTKRDPLAPAIVSRAFANLASELHATAGFRHLLIAGGATAAAVLPGLHWDSMKVVRVWAPGVVTLQPAADPGFVVTLKPGSYPWPASLRRALPSRLFS
jgi:D-threonate/D-erythronate kinase